MTQELTYLVLVTAFTALMWIPYVLDGVLERGLVRSVGYPVDPKPPSPWAQRLKAAHANAVENLVVFAALVLTAHAAGVLTDLTILATAVYFWARVAHAIVYTAAIPWARTFTFALGWLACIAIAAQLLM
jgi:uncharacterized MAPEG superfamily protein